MTLSVLQTACIFLVLSLVLSGCNPSPYSTQPIVWADYEIDTVVKGCSSTAAFGCFEFNGEKWSIINNHPITVNEDVIGDPVIYYFRTNEIVTASKINVVYSDSEPFDVIYRWHGGPVNESLAQAMGIAQTSFTEFDNSRPLFPRYRR